VGKHSSSSGAWSTSTPFPFVIGRDLVGTVVESPVDEFALADRVWCNSLGHHGRQGSFAQYAVVPRDRLYHLPVGVEALEAVPLAEAAEAHRQREAGVRGRMVLTI
jgi:NADPH:quinone reductase-like Zn-dependent oxidoreductase